VCATLTDDRFASDADANNLLTLAEVHTRVLSFSDYYVFGMQMPGRNASTSDYRYGFQGQETDDEITGSESHVSYKYRVHDARLGRFLSIDPLAPDYPHNSPYAFSENRVIDGTDLEGTEWKVANKYTDDNGYTVFELKVELKVINSSSLSNEQIKSQYFKNNEETVNNYLLTDIEAGIESDFSIRSDEDKIIIKTDAVLTFVDDPSEVNPDDDYYVELTDNVYGESKNIAGRVTNYFGQGGEHDGDFTQKNQMKVSVITNNGPTGRGNRSPIQVLHILRHELGHGAGIPHPWEHPSKNGSTNKNDYSGNRMDYSMSGGGLNLRQLMQAIETILDQTKGGDIEEVSNGGGTTAVGGT
jgi:RHS repeat-associated protein